MELQLPEIVATILGALSPILINFLKSTIESRYIRFVIALVVSGGVGAVSAIILGITPGVDLIEFFTGAFTLATIVYRTWKDLFSAAARKLK